MKEAPEGKETRSLFKRMKIRSKLISIISLIIILSLSSMILLATLFFRSDSEVRVIENNHRTAEVIALKLETDFASIIEKMRLMGTTMRQRFVSEQQKNLFTQLFFRNDPHLIYAGIASKNQKSDGFTFSERMFSSEFTNEAGIVRRDVEKISDEYFDSLSRAYISDVVLKNASAAFNIPVIAISIPFEINRAGNVSSVIICYVKLEKFLRAFQSPGITTTFMVNEEGELLGHPDTNLVLSGVNFSNLPIVQMMMKSPIDNGQTKYEDEEGVSHLGSFKKTGFSGAGVIAKVEEDVAFEEVYNIQRRNIYIAVIILNLSILIVYFFAKTLTNPILTLLGATKEIEKGNFRVDITPVSGDEIGELTGSFKAMGLGLEEREKMKDAFGKFVNKEIAEQVLKGNVKLGGERKMAAVFFSDIRSFTAISEKLEPEEVVEFLNEYMTAMVNCVDETHGVVDKFIGDAIMAIWGAPVSHGNDTENAINGALLMRKALMRFNVGRGGDKKPVIQIGSGINTGYVLAGQIGSDERMEYTVIGDAVNLASRIEALNKPFGTDLLISSDSYEKVKDIFRVEPMQKIKVKGKVEPQQIYAVLGRLDDPDSPRTLDELRIELGIEMTGKPSEEAASADEVKYEIIE